MLRQVQEERRGRRRPPRRTRAEIASRGKRRILGMREARRTLARRGDRQVLPPPAVAQVGDGPWVTLDDGRQYPVARAAVPASDWSDRVSEVVAGMLFDSIAEVAAQRELCARDPSRDFTRSRKIPLEMLLTMLVTWGQRTIGGELRGSHGWNAQVPTSSAFVQQWEKLSDEAMPLLMGTFLRKFSVLAYLGRFRLMVADGTGIRVPETGDERTRVRSNQNAATHDELHPTCAYDPMRHTFEDAVFQGAKKSNEPAALCELADRVFPGVTPEGLLLSNLWLADRNYCT